MNHVSTIAGLTAGVLACASLPSLGAYIVLDDYSNPLNYTYGTGSQSSPAPGVVQLNSTSDGYGAGRTSLTAGPLVDLSAYTAEKFELVIRRGTLAHTATFIQLKVIDQENDSGTYRFNVSSLPSSTDPFVTIQSVHFLGSPAFTSGTFELSKVKAYELQGSYGGVNPSSATVSVQLDQLQVIPEPASAVTLGLLGALGLVRRRRLA